MVYSNLTNDQLLEMYKKHLEEVKIFRNADPPIGCLEELARRYVQVLEVKKQYEAIQEGMECWYWDEDSSTPEHGTISAVYWSKDGKVESFGVDFGDDYDSFALDALGYSIFLSQEELFKAMGKVGEVADGPQMGKIVMVEGDILTPNKTEYKTLVCHQVNCQGVMGSGLARQVKRECPEAYEVYMNRVTFTRKNCLGDVVTHDISYKHFTIANIFGQWTYGPAGHTYTDYDALKKAFTFIAENYADYVIRIPYLMGCDRGGGDWGVVYRIIQECLAKNGKNAVEIWRLGNHV